jgi:iron-sulfur cluster repair protein YtfE (RIC family)
MDIFDVLQGDHEKVSRLMAKLEETDAGREEIFQTIKAELEAHTELEEEVFYPALEAAEETSDLIDEAYDEHHEVDEILAELDELPFDSEEWKEQFAALREVVELHVEKEEGTIFEAARSTLDPEALESMAQKAEELKRDARPTASRAAARADSR